MTGKNVIAGALAPRIEANNNRTIMPSATNTTAREYFRRASSDRTPRRTGGAFVLRSERRAAITRYTPPIQCVAADVQAITLAVSFATSIPNSPVALSNNERLYQN